MHRERRSRRRGRGQRRTDLLNQQQQFQISNQGGGGLKGGPVPLPDTRTMEKSGGMPPPISQPPQSINKGGGLPSNIPLPPAMGPSLSTPSFPGAAGDRSRRSRISQRRERRTRRSERRNRNPQL